MSRRTVRIAEQLRTEIARVLFAETTDPRIRLVTLTRVEVDSGLSRAIVYWSCMGHDEAQTPEQIDAGLRSAAPFVRSRLARVLTLRRVPELHFRFDPSLVLGDETLALLRSLAPEPSATEEGGAAATGASEGADGETT